MKNDFLRHITLAGVGALAALMLPDAAKAQYPEKPIRIVVPYSPGGGTDTFARRLATQLGPKLGQEIVVENIPGAGGALGMQAAAEAEPDGYTLAFALSSQFAVNVSLFDDLPYDPIEDFEPISLIGAAPYVLLAHPSLGVESLQELIDVAKERPGELSYASSGVGSGAHLATELLKTMADIDMVHIPYQGAGAAYPDLLSGRVPVMFATYAPVEGYIADGRLIPLAVTFESEAIPDTPPVSETLEGFDAGTWYAFAAPAGTPDDIIQTLNEAAVASLQEPELREQLEADAITIIASTPDRLAEYIPSEIEKWREVIETSGAKVE